MTCLNWAHLVFGFFEVSEVSEGKESCQETSGVQCRGRFGRQPISQNSIFSMFVSGERSLIQVSEEPKFSQGRQIGMFYVLMVAGWFAPIVILDGGLPH